MKLRILLAVPALAAVAACGGGIPAATTVTATVSGASGAPQSSQAPAATSAAAVAAEPRTEAAARKLAQEEADRYGAEDFAGAWELWSQADQKLVTEADYERLHTTCPPAGIALQVENVRLNAARTGAVARLTAAGFKFSYRLVYEAGQWRWRVNDDDAAGYRRGVDSIIAKMRKAGTCPKA